MAVSVPYLLATLPFWLQGKTKNITLADQLLLTGKGVVVAVAAVAVAAAVRYCVDFLFLAELLL